MTHERDYVPGLWRAPRPERATPKEKSSANPFELLAWFWMAIAVVVIIILFHHPRYSPPVFPIPNSYPSVFSHWDGDFETLTVL